MSRRQPTTRFDTAVLRQPGAIALAAMACCAWLVWAGQAPATSDPQQPALLVPAHVGPWVGTVVPVDQRTMEILETTNVKAMEYRLGQEPPVWFVRVAGFGNRTAFHPPELCYVGSHFEVLDRRPMTLLVHGTERHVMRLVISQGQERFEAWYWFTAGDRVTENYYQQQIWLLLDAIHHRPMSGTLVRVSTPIDTPDGTHRRLLAFVESLDSANPMQESHGS